MRAWLAGLAIIPFLTGCSPTKDLGGAQTAISTFHQQLDNSQFDTIYANASPDFKNVSSQSDFIPLLSAIHRKLGDFKSGNLVGWNDNVTTNGHFITLNYSATYDRGVATENFVYRVDGDQPLLAGYHVSSNALIEN